MHDDTHQQPWTAVTTRENVEIVLYSPVSTVVNDGAQFQQKQTP